MKLKNFIKNFKETVVACFKETVNISKEKQIKINHSNQLNKQQEMLQKQRELQQEAQTAELNRRTVEANSGPVLRKKWALALNSLPEAMRFSNIHIDEASLTNEYKVFFWEIRIPLKDAISREHCKILKNKLQEILNNQLQNSMNEFNQYLIEDKNDYGYQSYVNMYYGTFAYNVFLPQNNYNKYYIENSYKLLRIGIIDISCINNELLIHYHYNNGTCNHYSGQNYWNLLMTC